MKTIDFLSRTNKIAIFHTSRSSYRHGSKRELKTFADSFSADYFEENIFFDEETGMVKDESERDLCSIEEYNSNRGTLELDGDFDRYDWKPISELDEEDIKTFVYGKFGISVEFNDLYHAIGQPDSIEILMDLKADEDDIAAAVYYSWNIEDLIEKGIIELKEDKYELI